MMLRRLLVSFALASCAAGAAPAAAESLLEAQARASEALTARVQAALDRRFGPGRASVSAAVRLGLSGRGERWLEGFLAPPARGEETPRFSWEWPALKRSAERGGRFELPGIPAEAGDGAEPAPRGEPGAPPGGGAAPPDAAAELLGRYEMRIEDLRVRVLLDAALGEAAEAEALALAEAAADASAARGDRVTVERASFPTPAERALRDPAAWAALAGPLALALCGAALFLGTALAALALGRALRRGAEALSAAMVRAAQSRPAALDRPPAAGLPPPAAEAGAGAEGAAEEAQEEPAEGELVIELELEHVARLAHLLREQAPKNVALVLPHLKPEVRQAYLAAVGRDAAAAILLEMAPVRYVDPEKLRALKGELERRVRGVVGGAQAAAKVLEELGEAERKALLARLREKDPAAAAALREKVLLLEDLRGFEADALARIASALGPEPAAAAALAEEGLREPFAGSFSGPARRVFEEAFELGRADPDPERERAAARRAVEEAERLIRDGRARRPASAGVAAASSGALAAPAVQPEAAADAALEPELPALEETALPTVERSGEDGPGNPSAAEGPWTS